MNHRVRRCSRKSCPNPRATTLSADRYYKVDYKFWGYVRRPGQSWTTAKMVMLNENQKLAPDRELGKLGSDNNYDAQLFGSFSGDTVYEPASNGFYPEFVLKEVRVENGLARENFQDPGRLGSGTPDCRQTLLRGR